MPHTLYQYILRDVLKLLVLSAGVLVMLLSVGLAIKPISEGLLGPWQTIRVVSYLIPGVLPIALPFAASFATTMVFFRLAADNEISACAASGISYRSLLLPVSVLGLVLMLAMFFMSNFVVPTFWQRFEQAIEQDVTRLVIDQVRRRETIRFRPPGSSREFLLYADRAEARDMPADPEGPYRRVILQGVAVGVMNLGTGELETDYTGELAVADFYRFQNRHYVSVALTNAAVKRPDVGALYVTERQDIRPIEIPSPVQQNPKLLSLGRLREFAANPDLHAVVRNDRRALLERVVQQRAIRYAVQELATFDGDPSLVLRGKDGQVFYVTAPRIEPDEESVELIGIEQEPVVVRIFRAGVFRQRLDAETGQLRIRPDERTGQPLMDLSVRDVTVTDASLPTQTSQVKSVFKPSLSFERELGESLMDLGSVDLLRVAERRPNEAVQVAAKTLADRINELRRDIATQLHSRAAMAVNALLVMVLGAVMAMHLRNSTPLMIFFWCFLPTILAIIMLYSAENVVRTNPWNLPMQLNVLSIWVGDATLLFIVLAVYRRLRTN